MLIKNEHWKRQVNLIKIKGIFGFLQLEQNEPFRLCEPIITYSMSSLHGHTVRTQKAGSEGSPEHWSAPKWLHTSPVYTHPVFALSCPEVAVASDSRLESNSCQICCLHHVRLEKAAPVLVCNPLLVVSKTAKCSKFISTSHSKDMPSSVLHFVCF